MWPEEQMNIISTDMDPMCEEYGYKIFKGNNIQYKIIKVNKLDLSGYTAMVNIVVSIWNRNMFNT